MLIDVTGLDQNAVDACVNIVAAALVERGGTIEQLELKFPSENKIVPSMNPRVHEIDNEYLIKLLGFDPGQFGFAPSSVAGMPHYLSREGRPERALHPNERRPVHAATGRAGGRSDQMNIEKYTDRAKGFLQAAQTIALREGHQQFAPEHLLKALLDDNEGMAAGLIDRSGGNAKLALQLTDTALARLPKVSGAGAGGLSLTQGLARVFDTAEKAAENDDGPDADDPTMLTMMMMMLTMQCIAIRYPGVRNSELAQLNPTGTTPFEFSHSSFPMPPT